jgi:hypothetical protein
MVEADYQTHHSADMDIRLNQDFSGPPQEFRPFQTRRCRRTAHTVSTQRKEYLHYVDNLPAAEAFDNRKEKGTLK